MISMGWRMVGVAIILLGWAGSAGAPAAQDAPAPGLSAPLAPGVAQQLPAASAAAKTADGAGGAAATPGCPLAGLWPDLRGIGLTWFAVVVILLLTLQTRPLVAWRNLDGLVLALMCLLLALRSGGETGARVVAGQTLQWWSYVLLALVALYWLLRGLNVLFARVVRATAGNLSAAAMLVLLAAGLAICVDRVVGAPLSEGSRDGMIGGAQMLRTGKLPYGDVGRHDGRSPLLYVVHAGAVGLTGAAGGQDTLAEGWPESGGMVAARLVNLVLLLAVAAGVYVIGRRLHSAEIALAMVVIFCVFPGTAECLARPEIMLPAALLTWGVAFALLPGVGGLLSSACLVLAGVAWPWAWLALPVVAAYFLRRGWQAVGGTVGLLGGAAACIVGLTWLTAPTIPRADGALAAAGLQPAYVARVVDDGTLVIERASEQPAVQASLARPLWRFLVYSEECTLGNASGTSGLQKLEWPNGVDSGSIRYRAVRAGEAARSKLRAAYRAALEATPDATRAWVALRTVLEATWLSPVTPRLDVPGAWQLWAGDRAASAGRWTFVRRVVKVGVGLLAVGLAAVFLFGRPRQAYQLVGALLGVCSAALLASEAGPVTNLAWLLPLVLATLAVRGRQRAPKVVAGAAVAVGEAPLPDQGPTPRISVED